jgi:predicted  nucleic acid-binding Zn-ribbon protein
MAMEKMEERLRAMASLQAIDSRLDKIITLRGSLPEEVSDLEDDISGLESRKAAIDQEIKDLQGEIAKRKANIKDFADQIKKYEKQIAEVKNNREFEALTKEVEYANLEILTSEKKIKQFDDQIDQRKQVRDETDKQIEDRKIDLATRQQELDVIVADTAKEETYLKGESGKAAKKVEERWLNAYLKIRKNMRNGLAVVPSDRDACGGCFAIIPPQMHLEIRSRKKLIVCENCGRFLVDAEFFTEFAEKTAAE